MSTPTNKSMLRKAAENESKAVWKSETRSSQWLYLECSLVTKSCMASNSYFFPPNQRDPSQLSLTFSKKSLHPAHFLYSSLHFFSFLFQLSPEILLLLPAHFSTCSLSQKCLSHSSIHSLSLTDFFFSPKNPLLLFPVQASTNSTAYPLFPSNPLFL